MMEENKVRALLDDLYAVYMVGYHIDDLDSEAEKWGQIQILEFIFKNQGLNFKQDIEQIKRFIYQ